MVTHVDLQYEIEMGCKLFNIDMSNDLEQTYL